MTDEKTRVAGLPFVVACLGAALVVVLRGAVPFAIVSDHAYFMPAMWWFAEGGRLANPWMQTGFDQAFNWHGFVQPWTVGMAARLLGGGWGAVHLAVDLLAAATILAVPFVARALGASPWRATALVLVAVALTLDARSRPEVLATLETVLLVAACHRLATRDRIAWGLVAAIGALCALLVLTHPVVAVFACLAVATLLVVQAFERRPSARVVVGVPLVMGTAFAVTLAIHFSFVFDDRVAVWLDGMDRAGRLILVRADTSGFLRYHLANRFLPGFAIAIVPAALAFWALLRPGETSRAVWPRRVLMVAVGAVAVYLLHRFALRIPATYYNATGLLVAVCLIVAIAPLRGGARRLADLTLAALAAGALAGTLLWAVQALDDRPAVAPSRAALAAALQADRAAGRRICADAGALGAVDDPVLARAIAVSIPLADGPAAPRVADCDVYYALQMQDAHEPPPPVEGFAVDTAARRAGRLARIGLRPSHFGFTRWIPARSAP